MRHLSLVFLIWAFSSTCLAFSKLEANGPIQIQSDSASYDQLHHLAIHEGNVILTQDAHILKADKLTIQKDPKGNVITATGDLAQFEGKLKKDSAPVHATAKIIYYYPDKQLIVLEGNAKLVHQQDTFQGPLLNYQLDKQVISAARQSNERPTITIHPKISQK